MKTFMNKTGLMGKSQKTESMHYCTPLMGKAKVFMPIFNSRFFLLSLWASILITNMSGQTPNWIPHDQKFPLLETKPIYEGTIAPLYAEIRGIHKHPESSVIISDSILPIPLSRKTDPDSPIVVKEIRVNNFNGFYPPDNSLAIAPDQSGISCTNSSIWAFNSSHQAIYSLSLAALVSSPPGGHYFYDPRIIYAKEFDTYILVMLYGDRPSNTHVYILFGKPGISPSWNIYRLPGDPFQAGEWSDFPSIAIWGKDLAISLNLFDGNNSFSRSMIWQLGVSEGINGQPLITRNWKDLTFKPFTTVPVGSGMGEYLSPPYYLFSTLSGGGNSLYQISVPNSVYESAQPLVYNVRGLSRYRYAKSTRQSSGRAIDLGGCRVRSAYQHGGIVQLVFTEKSMSGYGAIRLVRIDPENGVMVEKTLEQPGIDYAFPSIAPYTNDSNRRDCIIGYLRNGPDNWPGIAAIWVDHGMNISKPAQLKEGIAEIKLSSDTVERWGDYSTTIFVPGSKKPDIYIAGCYALSSNTWGNRVFYLRNDADFPQSPIQNNSLVITNSGGQGPIQFSIKRVKSGYIQIHLVSMDGKWLKSIATGTLFRQESADITLYPGDLSPGIYMALVQDGEEIISSQRFLVMDR